MKISIKKIFTSINILFLFFILILAFIGLIMLGEHNSQKQIKILQKHEMDIKNIKNINTNDKTLDLIEFESISVELSHNLKNYFNTFNTFEPISFLSSSDTDTENFDIFKNMTLQFIANTKKYFKNRDTKINKLQFEKNYDMLHSMIFDMLNERISAEHKQFETREMIIYFALIIGLIFLFVVYKQLDFILQDIVSLYGVTSKDDPYEIKTMEVEAITTKFKLDSQSNSENPAHIDKLTKFKNLKGVIHTFNTTKAIRKHNLLSICVFDIDHYDILKRKFDNDFLELIRKKIAFIISLYEQPIDIIGAFDESKFILIMARNSKKEALDECEKIRNSVEETFFKIPNGEKLIVTISGGFITKPLNKSIDDSIQHTMDILKKAQVKGTNQIAQLSNYAEKL